VHYKNTDKQTAEFFKNYLVIGEITVGEIS
jgi:hypothetical protein